MLNPGRVVQCPWFQLKISFTAKKKPFTSFNVCHLPKGLPQ